MEVVGGFRAQPGCCMVCRTADSSKPIVDLGVPDQGVVNRVLRCYLCADCALQVGELICGATERRIVDRGFASELNVMRAALADEQARRVRAEGLLAELGAFAKDEVTT